MLLKLMSKARISLLYLRSTCVWMYVCRLCVWMEIR